MISTFIPIQRLLASPGFSEVRPRIKSGLYAKGAEELLFDSVTKVAIVGSRKMSAYGNELVRELVLKLSSYNACTVSGFMSGIDTAAHSYSLEYGVPTIAVLPSGIDMAFPRENFGLYTSIVEAAGLLLSEHAGDYLPEKWDFPLRNRIVACISTLLFVIEGTSKSGALITAECAMRLNRPVYTFSGNIFDANFQAALQLYKRGATLIVSLDELDEVLHKVCVPKECAFSTPKLSMLESLAFPRTFEELLRTLSCSEEELENLIFESELEGRIEYLDGKYSRVGGF